VKRQSVWRSEGRTLDEKGWAPLRLWVLWYVGDAVAVVIYYVILTPIWIGLRTAAWVAEFRARRARPS
jgi:hypothetical protein